MLVTTYQSPITESLQKEGNLTKTEIPAKIYVDGSFGETGWLPDSGLVTDAFKLKRRQLNDHYKSEIASLTK